jgi:choline dehydrogenase
VSELAPSYDHVVVGGGSAGCVVAARLAEDPARRVLLVEAGPDDRGVPEIAQPSRWVETLGGPHDWRHVYAPAPQLGGRRIGAPRGRILGGSGSLNAMLWNRGQPSDYDRWAAEGATGWSFADVLPFFLRCESFPGGEPGWRGTEGPIHITLPPDPHPLALAVLDAATERGLPVLADHNGRLTEGAALANLNIHAGQRWSTAVAYLHAQPRPANLEVLTNAQVLALEFDGVRCTGVTLRHARHVTSTRAEVEVTLCAGAFESPRLLMLAGLGDPAALARLGIACRAALPGVGRNLQDHPLLMGVNFAARRPLGPMRDQGGGAVVNWRSRPDHIVPDLHAFLVQGPHARPELRAGFPQDVFALSPGLMRSESRGWLRLQDSTPDAPMEIQPNYLAEPGDLEALVAGLDMVLDLAGSRALREWVGRPLLPERRLARDEAEAFVRGTLDTFFHPCGTCAIGSVVDTELRVLGTEGLRVADASVMPTIPTGNTHAPTVMIAERAAALIRGEPHA